MGSPTDRDQPRSGLDTQGFCTYPSTDPRKNVCGAPEHQKKEGCKNQRGPTILYLLILREGPIRRHVSGDEHSTGVLQHLPELVVTALSYQPCPVSWRCCHSCPTLKPHGTLPSGPKAHTLGHTLHRSPQPFPFLPTLVGTECSLHCGLL